MIDILNEMIENSDLTQQEIEKQCNFSKGYLSKILSGNIKPDENKLKSIAKVCNGNELLLLVAYWLEKAPKEIIEKIEDLQLSFLPYLETIANIAPEEITNEILEEVKNKYAKETKAQFVLGLLENNFQTSLEGYDIKITDNFDKVVLNQQSHGLIEITSDDMSPIIPAGSYIDIKPCRKYEDNDILYVKYKKQLICRRLIKISENAYYLYALKKDVPKIMINHKEDCVIIGKVIQVTTKL